MTDTNYRELLERLHVPDIRSQEIKFEGRYVMACDPDSIEQAETDMKGAANAIEALVAERDIWKSETYRISAYMSEGWRARAEAAEAKLREAEGQIRVWEPLIDPPVCRLQLPDGGVPGNAREAAEGWHRSYMDIWTKLQEAEAERDRAREAANELYDDPKIVTEEHKQYTARLREKWKAEMTRAESAEARVSVLEAALRGVLEANASFRATMPHDWDGDWLQDACNEARAALATESASAGDSDTRKDVMPSERKLSTDVPQPALPDLLPCPFCGKPAKLKLTTRGQWWVHCTAPYLCMGRGWSSLNEGFQLPQDAIDAWNRRALASQTQEPNHER